MIYQLAYFSYSKIKGNHLNVIDDILNKARSFNEENDITGMLLYRNEVFIQLLEGDKDKIQSLYGKIAGDPRHMNISTIFFQPAEERVFSDWTMGFKDISDFNIDIVNKLLPLSKKLTEKDAKTFSKKEILDLLKYFRYSKDFSDESEKKVSA